VADAVTRRSFLERTGAAALGAAGVYALVDALAGGEAAAGAAGTLAPAPEQHLLRNVRAVTDDGVRVLVPPLHHQVVTAKLRVGRSRRDLLEARHELERALRRLDRRFAASARGLGYSVGWGHSYFREHVPRLRDGRGYPDYLPVDNRASQAAGRPVPAFLDAIRFPSDPEDVVLEQNDVCVQFRSDSLERIAAGADAIFGELRDVFALTSVRKGFVGGGFGGRRSLPRRFALEAGVPGAASIPETAQLFLGFTCTQQGALGPERMASFETIPGLTDQWPDGYFRNGTTLHLSHVFEDLELWYGRSFVQRVWLAVSPGIPSERVDERTQTFSQGPADLDTQADVLRLAQSIGGTTGHSSTMHATNRLAEPLTDSYGVRHRKGTAILERLDFNTLDNPFFWSARPDLDRHSGRPAAGLHFLAFAPTSDTFHRVRLSMDGRYPDGTQVPLPPRSVEMGMNAALRTTHRQNFLVPPRRHRAFPLAELV
jgi:hypothetical protein